MEQTFTRTSRLSGTIRVPGDKSISHRVLLAAAMTSGPCHIGGLASGADVASTRACLERLGYRAEAKAGQSIILKGNGWRPLLDADLDAGNSGTTMRLLAGALAGAEGSYRLFGDASLSDRPMGRIAEPLRAMGAEVSLTENDKPPVSIRGGHLKGIAYRMPVASAQVKGALLFAGLQAEGTTRLAEPARSRDHTERLLKWLGANCASNDGSVDVTGGKELFNHPGFEFSVPGDFSSAAFLVAAAVLSGNAEVRIEELGLNPSRTALVGILNRMGATITEESVSSDPEPLGALTAQSSNLAGITVGGDIVPAVIDELPLVALAATQAEGTSRITGAGELRVKESDRIRTLASALTGLGASITELPDGWEIQGPSPLHGGRVNPRGDHRIAMTLAVAGTIAKDPVTIEDWECTRISYPGFEKALISLVS